MSHAIRSLALLGQHGVDVFFVISGFLITYLLLHEYEERGRISLKGFYLRRLFRIFPAFYAFLGVVGLLWALRIVSTNWQTYLSAASYTFNYNRHPIGWSLGHCWSLSLEEQFYLLWPPCLVMLGRAKSAWVAASVILLSPVSRAVTYVVAPSYRGMENVTLHTRLDTIMFGCLIALLYDNATFRRVTDRLTHPILVSLCLGFFLIVSPLAEMRYGAKYLWTVGFTCRAFCVSIVMLYAIKNARSIAGRFLNARVTRHVGVISYGLYLWQQPFTAAGTFHLWHLIPILGCAEASYILIEKPAFRLRDAIQRRMFIASAETARGA